MFGNASPFGFLTTARAENVHRLIGKTEQLVIALELGQTPFNPAEDALRAAKALYAIHDYSEAVAQAKRAGTLAVSLNERFNAYMIAWKGLQTRLEDLHRLSLPTGPLEDILSAAEKEVAHGIEDDGAVVPNYDGAKALLDQALDQANSLLLQATRASKEIFHATLAVEALWEIQPGRTSSWAVARLEEVIERATRELAVGNVQPAYRIASAARTRAIRIRNAASGARDLIGKAELDLAQLLAQGVIATRLAERIAAARQALANGPFDPTTALAFARRVSNEVASLRENHSRARKLVAEAERVYSLLQREGFRSNEVDLALLEAHRALGNGHLPGVKENVSQALRSFVRRRDAIPSN